jgi:hypothetical protein
MRNRSRAGSMASYKRTQSRHSGRRGSVMTISSRPRSPARRMLSRTGPERMDVLELIANWNGA